jgi:TPR repeat protein
VNATGVAFGTIAGVIEMKILKNLIALAAALLLAIGLQAADKAQVEKYRQAAEKGSVFDQTVLGSCYEYGNGVTKDAVEAMKWYRKAADQGYKTAQVLLGFCYKNGEGVATNQIEAVKWFRKAAEAGDSAGQYMVGFSYQYGKGVDSNRVEAYKWLNLAATQDYEQARRAQSEVGSLLTKEEMAEAQRLVREFKPQKAP